MQIALFGYGKMGKTIERLALKRGHSIVAIFDKEFQKGNLSDAEVAIDFSIPKEAFNNINKCFNENIPIISGTTGWVEKLKDVEVICKEKNGAFIYASNFSLGVNLFFELNRHLAKIITGFENYNVAIEEIHHQQKLDAPSGTAISLAEGIIENSDKKNWELDVTNNDTTIPIVAKRIEDVPGTHTVTYGSVVDEIEIKHTAKNRDGFALGAIIAAEWLQDKIGVYTMKDVLGIKSE